MSIHSDDYWKNNPFSEVLPIEAEGEKRDTG